MATKTLTITEDAYNLLAQSKQEGESFSGEIRRIFSKKKVRNLMDFFGVLSYEEGEEMLAAMRKKKKMQIELHKNRIRTLMGASK